MKRLYAIVGTIALAAALARASWVYSGYLVNQTVTANQNFALNLNTTPNASGIVSVTAQAVYSTVTLPTDTFNDGRVSTASITVISNTGISSATATNQITVAATAVITSSSSSNSLVVLSTNGLTGATITLNGNTIHNSGWRIDLASHTATDIAAQINLQAYAVIATAASTTIGLVARTPGAAGNLFTLVSSTPTALSATALHFTGGQNDPLQNQTLTINGTIFKNAYSWNIPNTGPVTSSGTATSIANLISHVAGMRASAAGSVVYATATVVGTAANAFTITSSTPSAITVAHPTFTGGVDNAVITVDGVPLTQGIDWLKGGTVTQTAAAIAAAMNANSTLHSIVVSTNIAGVVFSTSTAVGTLSNYTLTTSTASRISVSNPTFVGGSDSSFTINAPTIAIASHGYATGAAVLLSTGGVAAPLPLINRTTYYVIAVDANDIELATTSARAFANQYLTFTSSSTTGPHTFTLTPLVFTGTPGLQWAVSNDCVNYTNLTQTSLGVSVSSLTIASPWTAGSTTWNLGPVNYQCLEAIVAGPTTGGLSLKVQINGSNP